MDSIGTRLRRARHAMGVGQKAVADHLGVSRPMISQWESGKHDPEKERFPAIAAYYGGDAEWFERGIGTPPPMIDEPAPTRRSAEEVAREADFVRDFRKLHPHEREAVHATARGYLALRKDKS